MRGRVALRERGGEKDKQQNTYISQLPINCPMAALLVVIVVIVVATVATVAIRVMVLSKVIIPKVVIISSKK